MDNPTSYIPYRYVHAKSSWMTAAEELQTLKELAEVGGRDGTLDAFMKPGQYGSYLADMGQPEPGYSYFISVVPTVYSLINSIEQIVRGFNYVAHPDVSPKQVLKLADLLELFHSEFAEQTVFTEFVDRYTDPGQLPELLSGFLQANGKTISDVFNTKRTLKSMSFFTIADGYSQPYPYTPEQGKPFFEQIAADVAKIAPLVQSLMQGIDDDGNPTPAIAALARS